MGKSDHLVDVELAEGEWSWNSDRALLYAVGLGAGLQNPLEERQFTTENTPDLPQQIIPTFLSLMNLPADWAGLLGWNVEGLSPIGVVHGEQSVTLDRPIPVEGKVHLKKVLRGVYDKGSGALLDMETRIADAVSGEPLGTNRMKLFAQGKGGFGGPRTPPDERPWTRPDAKPDAIVSLPVGLNQSLIYRLSGDRHPHGTDPGRARLDGFERPIFYGLGTYGVACRALISILCDGDAGRFGHMEGRFSKPVFPGDRLDTHIWRTDDGAIFQTLANGERIVLDRGIFRFR
jgi:acyl dehydratase